MTWYHIIWHCKTFDRIIVGWTVLKLCHHKKCVIPRITLYPSSNTYPFKFGRRQFPIRLAYAMTINKNQGQTFRRTGLLLPQSCFTHGQLYVAFSRCGHPPDDKTRTGLKVVVYDTQIQGRRKDEGGIRTNETEGTTTQNIVLTEIFKWLVCDTMYNYDSMLFRYITYCL